MKNLFKNLLLLTSVFSLVFLFSCGDDEELPALAAPSLTVTAVTGSGALSNGGEVIAGDSVQFTIDVTAAGGFNTLFASGSLSTQVSRNDLSLEAGATAANDIMIGWVKTTSAQVGSTAAIKFVASDEASQTDTVDFSFTIVAPPSADARSYTAILLAAPLGDVTANKTSETFFSSNTGETYSMNEVNTSSDPLSADIDFGYFFGSGTSNTGATLSDPASYPFAYGQAAWGKRNATVFRRTSLTESQFIEKTTFADIDAEYDAATAADSDSGIESGLVAGEVLAFATDASKTGGSKKGLVLVKAITPGDGELGNITLEILVQEEAN